MSRLTKIGVLIATCFTMALSPLAQVSAAPAPMVLQNYGQDQGAFYGGDVEQVRHKGRHHYHRHHHYKKHRKHRSNRHCRYSPRRGTMMCRPHHYRHWW